MANVPKSKGNGTGADTIILQATTHPTNNFSYLKWESKSILPQIHGLTLLTPSLVLGTLAAAAGL